MWLIRIRHNRKERLSIISYVLITERKSLQFSEFSQLHGIRLLTSA